MISVGVDIGTYSIKVADIESSGKSYVIRRVQEFPLSLDPTKDRKIEVIDTLRTLFSTYDLDHAQFIFSLPQKYVSARLLNFPFRERFKVQKAVASQLEDELPFSQEDAVFDVKIIRYQQKTSDVLAMAVPKERISEIVDLAHDCGIQPVLISTDSMGLDNLFENWSAAPPEAPPFEQEIPTARMAELVLNVGHTSTQVLVYAQGLLVAVRHIDWGAKNLADAVGSKYGLNYLQAMRELQTKGFVLLDKTQGTREQIAFSQVIEDSLNGLVSDMRLKLLELQSEQGLQWTSAKMVGGGSQLKNLGAYLTQQFQIPFNRFKQFETQATSFEASANLEMVSSVAVGLAVEGLRRARNPATNFMKGEFAQQSKVFESLWEKWGYTAQLVASAFVVLVIYAFIRDGLTATLVEKSDEVLRKQAKAVANIDEKKATPARIHKFISAQEQMEKNRKQAEKVVKINSPLDLLDQISSLVPARERIGMEIKWVEVDNEQADIAGYANSAGERDQVQKALSKLATDGKVVTIGMKNVVIPPGKTGFSYRVHVNRYSGG
jgi:general secretion pathway protein L